MTTKTTTTAPRDAGPIHHLGWLAALGIGAVWMLAALTWATPAPYSVDGVIYHAMAEAAATKGTFFFDNGYAATGLPGLRLQLTVLSEGRLTGQYPGGWGFIAAPAYALGGVKGLMAFNVLAGAATLLLIWRLAGLLFEDARIALIAVCLYGAASFAVDYTIAVWPHAPAVLTTTAALTAAAYAWRRPERGALWMAVSGMAIGIGLNIRVDVLFPAIGLIAWVLMTGARPYRDLAAFAFGALPGGAAATAINWVKFGVVSPITYGSQVGDTTLGAYAELAPLLAFAAVALLLLGLPSVRRLAYRRAVACAGLLLGLAVVLALTPLRDLAGRVLTGFWVLVIDFQAHPLPAKGLALGEDGVLRAYGIVKKALLQSAPYLAILIALVPLSFQARRVEYAFIALVGGAVILPFTLNAWHGGNAPAMRYFMGALPILTIGAAAAMIAIYDRAGPRPWMLALSGLAVLCLAVLGAGLSPIGVFAYWQIDLPLALAALTALAALIAFAPGVAGRFGAAASGGLCVVGAVVAIGTSWVIDARTSEGYRGFNTRYIAHADHAPPNALIVAYWPKMMPMRLNQGGAMLAMPLRQKMERNQDFVDVVRAAWAAGRPVWSIGDPLTAWLIENGLASEAEAAFPAEARVQIYALTPPEEAPNG